MATRRYADARVAYLAAAREAPTIQDWLLLRAAQLTSDSAARAVLYSRLSLPAARQRILIAEAVARERAGDHLGAAPRFDSIGKPIDALRVRLLAANTLAERSTIRLALHRLLENRSGEPEARLAGDLLDARFKPLNTDEHLAIARSAMRMSQFGRAIIHYPGGLASPRALGQDHLDYGRALLRAGRPAEAIVALDRLRDPRLVAATALARARAQLRLGDTARALTTLSTLARGASGEESVLAQGLFLTANVAWDGGHPDAARRHFLELGRRFPESDLAPRARFLGALVAWDQGLLYNAAREWEELRRAFPLTETAAAAGYWAGRARHRLGDDTRARDIWESVLQRDSLSYYAVVSAGQLGVPPWTPLPATDYFVALPAVDSAMARMSVLSSVGLAQEASWERDWVTLQVAGNGERGLSIAHAFRRAGDHPLAARLARNALTLGSAPDARAFRLLYPLPYQSELAAIAGDVGLDPLVVAALTRQESLWAPRATSSAGARGLMQIMPATGRDLARRLKMPGWSPDMLYDPSLNLRFGVAYLHDLIGRHQGDLARSLAAYNAGPSRVARWATRPGADDHDFMIERIPFDETRHYVRAVRRNLVFYRALYGNGA